MIAAILLACAAAAVPGAPTPIPAQDESTSERSTAGNGAVEESADPHPILSESPDAWPHAEDRAWDDWRFDARPTREQMEGMRRAAIAWERGDLPASLAALFALLEEHPDYPPALYQAGAIYFRLRRYGDAVTALERYLDVAPQRVGDTRALGHALYTLGEYERAAAHYRRVLAAQDGDHPETLRGLALAEWKLGEPEAALEHLDRVLALDPEHEEADLWRARILYDEGRLEEALSASEAARERDPFAPQAWFVASRVLFELDRAEEAEAARERFLQLDRVEQETRVIESQLLYEPHRPRLRARLVELRAGLGDLEAVRRALAEWIGLDPENLALRIHAIDVLVSLQDRDGADLAAESLRRIAGDDAEAWTRLARYYAATRQRKQQVEAERKLAELRAREDG